MHTVDDKMDDLIKYLKDTKWFESLDKSGQLQVRVWFRTLYANIRTRRQLAQADPVDKFHELFDN